MCGIAGYNVSEEWAAEHISAPAIQKAILTEAWLHNLHRGSDAAGYFALKDDGAYKVYKQNKDAASILNKNLKRTEIPVTRVFGAHTRAMTKGDAAIMANNHPVYYGGVFATHNGSIRNDEEIKKTVSVKEQAKLAEVDSVAIPIQLASVDNPLDVDALVKQTNVLEGGYAFHAVWREHPGVSVLAKGSSSPLMLAVHEAGGILYASEPEALWGMIKAMQLDPVHDGWNYYSVQENNLIVIQDGQPVAWKNYSDKPTEIISRLLPKAGKDNKLEVVYTSKTSSDFAQKGGERGRILDYDHAELQYTCDDGFVSKVLGFPRNQDTDFFSVTSEADRIVQNKITDNRHVFIGDVEIIMSGRVVLDIYDHSKFKNEQRWFVDPQVEIETPTFGDFLSDNANKVLQTPDPNVKYKYDRNNVIPLVQRRTEIEVGTKVGGLTSKTEGLEYIEPNPVLTSDNLWHHITDHSDFKFSRDGFVFMHHKLACSKHGGVLLQNHDEPDQCGGVKASAAYALSCAKDLEVLTSLMPASKIVEIPGKMPCANGMHDIVPTVYFEIILESDRYFNVLVGEECLDCDAMWELKDIPFWLLGIVGGKKDMMVP